MQVRILDRQFEVMPEPRDFWGWVEDGSYDWEWKAIRQYAQGKTFVDLGAWVGSHSLYASTVCPRVIAVEPDPVAYPILCANLQNIDPRPVVHQIAISDNKGTITLGSSLLGCSTTRANNVAGPCALWVEGQIVDVPCTTLRELCSQLPDPLCIKMDVEGSEEAILTDYEFFAERRPALLLSLHPFWWKKPNAWEIIRKVGRLYDQVLTPNLTATDINTTQGRELIFI